jgi:tight adherence protein B
METLIIAAVVFVGVTAVIGALGLVFRDRGRGAEDRLTALTTRRQATASSPNVEIWKEAAFDSDKKTLLDSLTPRMPSLQKMFQQADAHIKPGSLMGISIVLGVLGCSGSWLLGVPAFLVPFPGLILFTIPWLWLWNQRRKRLKAFAAQLPDALELVARALRAGHSLAAGMHVVAEEMPMPISIEFGRVYEEQNLGIQLEDAMRSLCDRVPNLDLRFFVTSVAIQRQTGGDLAEILDKIGYVVRERFRILGQVRALTGEGRLSGVVLIALPFVLFFVVLHLNPKYIEMLWTTDEGINLAIGGLVSQIIGALWIRKIVNIKV